MRELVLSIYGHNNLVSRHLWWKETVLKRKKEIAGFVDVMFEVGVWEIKRNKTEENVSISENLQKE